MSTPLKNVLDKLPHAKETGDGWRAKCPVHNGKTETSLSISEKNGTVLIKCFSGCEFIDILNALKLKPSDLFSDNGSKSRVVATYDYVDESGKLLYQAVRKEPKSFMQRKPDGKGGWVWKRAKRLVLYRLPEVLACDPSEYVFVVEGEKTANALVELGVCATTSAMGAEAWNRGKAEYVEALSDRNVCILPDNDVAGKRYANDIGLSLLGNAASVLILDLPNLSTGQDPFDWIDSGGDKHTLLYLVESDARAFVAPEIDKSAEIMLSCSADDVGNAECVIALHGSKFKYTAALGWMQYNGKHWDSELADPSMGLVITDTLRKRRIEAVHADREAIIKATSGSDTRVRACKNRVKDSLSVSIEMFDVSPDMLNCNNGVVDLRTGELEPHDATQNFTYCIKANYDADASDTIWLSFLHEVVGGDQALVDYLQRCVGYSLTGYTREEILFYLYGPTRSGKGTFTETILALLGRPLSTETDFGVFTARREVDAQNFALAPLKPARFVAASESNKYERLNGGKVKGVTGGNYISCAHKHKDPFSYRPQFKIWLSSNHNVNGDPDDGALWARLRVIEFPNSFLGREDKHLKAKLRTPEALTGLLAWAVKGARLWYASSDGLEAPEAVKSATEGAKIEADFVEQWLKECITYTGSADNFIPNAAMYASYREWCKDNGVTEKHLRGLTGSLKAKGYDAGAQKWHKGRNMRGCSGICFASDPQTEPLDL